MIRRPFRSFISLSRAVCAAASVVACAAVLAAPVEAFAQASSASAVVAAAAASGQTYAVKPGKSLNNVAGDLTGSKDRDVREKMARALFDANPNAFVGHDINRLKLGSTLNVPPADGGASATQAASAPGAPEAAPAAPTSAQTQALATAASAASEGVIAAHAPAPMATAPAGPAAPKSSRTGPDPMLFGLAIAVLVVLFAFAKWRGGKRRAAKAKAAEARDTRFARQEEAQAEVDARNEALRREREPTGAVAAAAYGAASLENEAVQGGQSELHAVAASVDDDAAAKTPEAPSEEDEVESAQAAESVADEEAESDEKFVPASPASHHPDFVLSSVPGAAEAEAHEGDESHLLEAEARHAAENSEEVQQAREAAAREITAHDAELREAKAQAVEDQKAEQRENEAHHVLETADDAEEEGLSPTLRFPMPKFPDDAIEVLDSLDLNLPPRMELTLDLPVDAARFVPQAATPGASEHSPTVAMQMEAGTAGAVAGLGATQFPSLSLDFDANQSKSQSSPLPAMTTAQLAALARNKLELASEYIELGDLQGARTLLQEVITSHDRATRPVYALLAFLICALR